MSPEAQIRLGKGMQLAGIFCLIAMLVFVFSMGTGFLQGQDEDVAAMMPWSPLLLIYGTLLSTLGVGQVRKGRSREAEAWKAEQDIAARAEGPPAIEQSPQVCRTGGEHIYLGDDATCLNGCGIIRGQVNSRIND
jgi:hypothetical protein